MIFSICIILFFIIYLILYFYEINLSLKEIEALNPIDISNYIIWYAYTKLNTMVDINNIMSILFVTQGIFLAKFNSPLFKEDFILWHIGPILENVYNHYKIYRGTYIPINIDFLYENDVDKILPINFPKEKLFILNTIINEMAFHNGWESIKSLSKIDPCYKKYGKMNKIISKEDIKNYYKEILNG